MDLKETLQDFLKTADTKHTELWVPLVTGALGVVIIAVTLWLAFGDSRSQAEISRVTSQRQEVIDQLAHPVQALKRVMIDEQVQALAGRAIASPATLEDLRSYLNGRINQIIEVRVFGPRLESVDPGKLGLNGYAVVDMLLDLQENRLPQLQLHNSLVPPRMVDAVQVMSGMIWWVTWS